MKSRGYLIPNTANFLRENVSAEDWTRIRAALSPELNHFLDKKPDPAGWYPISLLAELNRHVADSLGQGDDERARDAFYRCAKYAAHEASNTFLRIFLKMLSPTLIAKKVPDLFRRDFNCGDVKVEVTSDKVVARLHNVPGFDHSGVLCPGFTAFGMEAAGATIDKIVVHDWSLKTPNVDGTWFEMWWH